MGLDKYSHQGWEWGGRTVLLDTSQLPRDRGSIWGAGGGLPRGGPWGPLSTFQRPQPPGPAARALGPGERLREKQARGGRSAGGGGPETGRAPGPGGSPGRTAPGRDQGRAGRRRRQDARRRFPPKQVRPGPRLFPELKEGVYFVSFFKPPHGPGGFRGAGPAGYSLRCVSEGSALGAASPPR